MKMKNGACLRVLKWIYGGVGGAECKYLKSLPNISTATPYLPRHAHTEKVMCICATRRVKILRSEKGADYLTKGKVPMLQAKSATMVSKNGCVSKKGLHIYYRGEIAVNYSTSSNKGRGLCYKVKAVGCLEDDVVVFERDAGGDYQGGDEARTRTHIWASGSPMRARSVRTRVRMRKKEPTTRSSGERCNARATGNLYGLSALDRKSEIVGLAPHGKILGHADFDSKGALELGLRDGPDIKSIVDCSGDDGTAVQVDAVAGIQAAVLKMQLGLVPRFGAAAEGAGTVTVGDVHVNVLLGSSAEATRGDGGGSAAA
ncbi:hypothetical protein B0H16DRAFT_1475266 [Mycena metata]|uniref:Uncharacterized protein n=1 Tax=Mycena metata TaxID=1033252 RepID=A0AAD7HEY3_9AGAR|nr:hypothetical protein B0H16DRAFT_1475266 [Mycena metata]